ncbi:Casein lytic proteinase B4 [Hibiscus syriacus]|uniref:Casein lytic proteinase B4 n=1 Tax=Hibiscus syriacus TaxID=106335 RepID=A0A6A2YPE1_HIBSY|nr:Casein lytic proteinase B4 [Hibiscus syriacus]
MNFHRSIPLNTELKPSSPITLSGQKFLVAIFRLARGKLFKLVDCNISPSLRGVRGINPCGLHLDDAETTKRVQAFEELKLKLNESNEPKKTYFIVKKAVNNGKPEKLVDILNLAEVESDAKVMAETTKWVQAFEELKRLVKDLQVENEENKRVVASRVRLLTKEDPKTRVTLVMLGTIPPLVAMFDFEDFDSHIAALYALLNLEIGNDP